MKALALTTLALVGTTVSGLKLNKLFQSSALRAELELPAETANHTCTFAIDRINAQSNFNYNATIAAGKPWTDPLFGNSSALLWHDYNDHNIDGYLSGITWARANARIPNATLFGSAGAPNRDNIHQGALGDCYYLSSVAADAEWAQRVKNVFLTQSYNSAGIFALNVYIRGKPTLLVIDDFLPFWGSTGSGLIFD